MLRADRVADEVILHLAAAIDEHRLRGFLGEQILASWGVRCFTREFSVGMPSRFFALADPDEES